MTSTDTTGARGAWPPRASGPPSTPSVRIRARADEEIALLGNLDVPPLRELDLDTATPAEFRTAVMRFVEANYEDDGELCERLGRGAENDRAAYLVRLHEAHDQANEAIRADKHDLARLPMLAELQARRREYPEPRPMVQAPGWPAPVIPGSGGRRLGENEMEHGAA